MSITTEDGGRTNVYAKEPQMKVLEVSVTHNEKAEQLNGRVAMLGVIAAIGALSPVNSLAECLCHRYLQGVKLTRSIKLNTLNSEDVSSEPIPEENLWRFKAYKVTATPVLVMRLEGKDLETHVRWYGNHSEHS